jgi:hypothetical protein
MQSIMDNLPLSPPLSFSLPEHFEQVVIDSIQQEDNEDYDDFMLYGDRDFPLWKGVETCMDIMDIDAIVCLFNEEESFNDAEH